MVPLDPPYFHTSTVGGVVAANLSGPRRRLYGSARDMIIGMKFVTLEGKAVQSGGMVVKNVAGLDMAKLMIGSFGTLAAIAVVNFKLAPLPPATRTFVLRFGSLDEAMEARDAVLTGVLQPAALDLLNPVASQRVRLEAAYTLLLQASGSPAVLDRYARELPAAEAVEGDPERTLWTRVREFTPSFLAEHPEGAVVRHSTSLAGVRAAIGSQAGPAVARAGTGVVYAYVPEAKKLKLDGGKAAIEFAPEAAKPGLDLWPSPGSDFEMMRRIKQLFDPDGLLNRGRLYGRI
jgi:glycolate oxidase FAD binding subunit